MYLNNKTLNTSVEIVSISTKTKLPLPLINQGISAGFPSPASDFIDIAIDLNKHLIKHPSSTFFGRVKGDSMIKVGISDGDLLVIDKSINPANNKIAVCFIDGEFTVKKIKLEKNRCWLVPENDAYKAIEVTEENNFLIWGIVVHVIKSF
jgi:DNA polymerase V